MVHNYAQRAIPGRVAYALIVLLFLLSGASSLIYQVIWSRSLVFVFGSTTFASSTVLAVFMGGLAIGSFVAGRICDRLPTRKTLQTYGWLEGAIGLWALLAPLLFEAAIPLYRVIWQATHISTVPFSLLRFLIAALILLLPTACMGATLPLLAKYVAGNLKQIGDRIGTLYAVNTLGAIVGSAVAGFYLLPSFGITVTTYIAAACNLLLFGAVMLICSFNKAGEAEPSSVSEMNEDKSQFSPVVFWTMLAFAISGAVAMIYEVGWTRTLLMVIGSTTYAFTIMLSTFLLGIFLGSLVAAKLVDRTARPFFWFCMCQVLLFAAGLLSIFLFNYVPYWNLAVNKLYSTGAETALYIRFLLSAIILLPISIFLGAIFPVAVKVCTTDSNFVGRSIGSLYSANTLGAIIGAFLAGFVIVPIFGAERTLLLCAGLNLLLGVVLFTVAYLERTTVGLRAAAIGASLALIAGLTVQPSVWDHVLMLSAQQERRLMSNDETSQLLSYEAWRDRLHSENRLLAWYDGACASVGVLEKLHLPSLVDPKQPTRSLLTNGHIDASSGTDMPNQILLSAFPLLAKPQAKEIAVIGWGSGVTIGTAALAPQTNVHAIEIEPAVVEAAKLFSSINFEPEKNPRVHLEINDGRNYLLATNKKFDIIISEPSNPWQAGVCNLFTKEFFASAKRCLNQDGVFALWLQVVQISPGNMANILGALRSQFEYVLPMWSDSAEIVVLASSQPLQWDYAQLKETLPKSALKDQLSLAGISSAEDVLARIASTPSGVTKLVSASVPNSDDRNSLEYQVSKTYEDNVFREDNEQALAQSGGNLEDCVDWKQMDLPTKSDLMLAVSAVAAKMPGPRYSSKWAQLAYRTNPSVPALVACAQTSYLGENYDEADQFLSKARKLDPENVKVLLQAARANRLKGDFAEAKSDLEQLLKLDPQNAEGNLEMALTLMPSAKRILAAAPRQAFSDDPQLAKKHLQKIVLNKQFVHTHTQVLFVQAALLKAEGKLEEAAEVLRDYLRLVPSDVAAWRMLARLEADLGQTAASSTSLSQSEKFATPLLASALAKGERALKDKQYERAANLFASCLELDPGNEQAMVKLKALAQSNRHATRLLERVVTP